ncbi:MAG: arsenate reductase ArsC [Planctomycetota bacterium]
MKKERDKIRILFLCTANACRSQMAEGWAEHLKSDVIEAFSAGIMPAGVSSRAIKVMAEAGVDISHHTSKHFDELEGIEFDYVVTLCDNAREFCPVFAGKTKVIHKSFADPSVLTGKEEVIMDRFRKIRDQIRHFVETMPEGLEK